jgi:hypothetical protein
VNTLRRISNVDWSSVMDTMRQIQHALERLSIGERELIADWLQKLMEAQSPGYGVAEPRTSYAAVQPPFMTVDEYMQFEEKSPVRHEYVNGAIYAMTGVSVAHARIARGAGRPSRDGAAMRPKKFDSICA